MQWAVSCRIQIRNCDLTQRDVKQLGELQTTMSTKRKLHDLTGVENTLSQGSFKMLLSAISAMTTRKTHACKPVLSIKLTSCYQHALCYSPVLTSPTTRRSTQCSLRPDDEINNKRRDETLLLFRMFIFDDVSFQIFLWIFADKLPNGV